MIQWPRKGSTNVFIYPPYGFKTVDAIPTNFHLPKLMFLQRRRNALVASRLARETRREHRVYIIA